MKSLYLIAIVPSEAIREDIKLLKEEIKTLFGVKHALKLPAHITLQHPFWVEGENENQLIENLKAFADKQEPPTINLVGFGNFSPRVIFVKIENHRELIEMQLELQEALPQEMFQNSIQRQTEIHPHITIATRDLKEDVFPKAWERFQNQEYSASFIADSLTLFKHTGKVWEVKDEFPFSRT